MQTSARLTIGRGFDGPVRERSGLVNALVWLGGFLATGLALAICAILTVIAATAVALIALVGGVLVFLTGLALRARRRVYAPSSQVLEARKVGHAWVAYGWDRSPR